MDDDAEVTMTKLITLLNEVVIERRNAESILLDDWFKLAGLLEKTSKFVRAQIVATIEGPKDRARPCD
ncbi:hypothetical protein EV193_101165 [Herbihabitans rhizosphaerae]|uniref:Uncharacterized protein n=1 Tax=Herbihabitans rhizosphaerae TaxID=1872711 RepID=A0A4Q7L621_9PSEU|nr:hypothetical protein [Herbihabitans rhizosphaerae]RZS44290.1 hypothetical protein EV193_101165 [Herbihabitans rhizosphaerae]